MNRLDEVAATTERAISETDAAESPAFCRSISTPTVGIIERLHKLKIPERGNLREFQPHLLGIGSIRR